MASFVGILDNYFPRSLAPINSIVQYILVKYIFRSNILLKLLAKRNME